MKPETSVGTSAQAEGLLGGDTARMRALAEYLGHWRAMSVDAVRAACNQSSSREPIVDYDGKWRIKRCARSRTGFFERGLRATAVPSEETTSALHSP
jgi:hypothetical protein